MNKIYYIKHYFDFRNAGSFLLVSFVGLFLVLAVVLVAARIQTALNARRHAQNASDDTLYQVRKKHFTFIESFYEMVFSSTSVLLFLSLYYIIDEKIPAVAYYWEKYQNVLLLIFILASVFATNWLDSVLIRLTHISPEQKASIRLLSSFYIVLILLYIRFIYQDTNYNTLILYFITLAAGRFLYFDFTWKDFSNTIRCLCGNLPPSAPHVLVFRYDLLVWLPRKLPAEIERCDYQYSDRSSVHGSVNLRTALHKTFEIFYSFTA